MTSCRESHRARNRLAVSIKPIHTVQHDASIPHYTLVIDLASTCCFAAWYLLFLDIYLGSHDILTGKGCRSGLQPSIIAPGNSFNDSVPF